MSFFKKVKKRVAVGVTATDYRHIEQAKYLVETKTGFSTGGLYITCKLNVGRGLAPAAE